jgi:molybdenum cofactor cytidylyltransferase
MITGAVVTAAGMSSRMGDFKPMMNIGSITIAQRVIATLKQAGAEIVVVVTGFRADDIERHLAHCGVIFLRNEKYASTQMFDSAVIGLDFLRGKCDRILLTPVDIPLFTSETVTALLDCGGDLVLPVCGEDTGHPILISSRAAGALVSDGGEGGLRSAMLRCGYEIKYVPVADRGILHDADTPEDYRALLAYHNRQILRPEVDIRLAAEKPFFDSRIAMLLFLIDDTSSVRLACQQMQISYSSGWKLINSSEEELGFRLVSRCQGGVNGSRTTLTPEGAELLTRYRKFSTQLKTDADELFEKYFNDVFSV